MSGKNKKPWSDGERGLLREIYADLPTVEVATHLGRSLSSVRNEAFNQGLHKSAVFMASENSGRISKLTDGGRLHRFSKGHVTWNKGMKGLQIGGTETRFKHGHKPQTWVPVGSERVDKDGVLMRKVSDSSTRRERWKPVHVLIWEEANGPLPDGHIVVFADRDRDNFRLENLVRVTRAENMKRNSHYNRYPKEISRLIQLRGALNRQIRKREDNAKQD